MTKQSSAIKYNRLIGSIYESIFDENGFNELIPKLNQEFDAKAGGYCIQNKQTQSFSDVYMHGFDDGALDIYEQYYADKNPWFTAQGLITENTVMTEQTLDAHYGTKNALYETEYFNDWLKPIGLSSTIGVTLSLRRNSCLNFSMLRSSDDRNFTNEDVQLVDQLTPHLLRTIEANEIISTARTHNKLLLNGLDQMNMGLMLLDCNEATIELNHSASEILNSNDGLTLKSKNLRASHPQTNAQIESAIHAGNLRQSIGINTWIHVPRLSSRAPYQLLIIHNNDRPLTTFTEAGVITMVILIDPARKNNISRDTLKAHLSLTERETDVAQRLLQGIPTKRIALETGLSYESTRWYVKKICAKSNTKSQNEFIAKVLSELSLSTLISGIPLPQP